MPTPASATPPQTEWEQALPKYLELLRLQQRRKELRDVMLDRPLADYLDAVKDLHRQETTLRTDITRAARSGRQLTLLTT